jgi:hypothetical protein
VPPPPRLPATRCSPRTPPVSSSPLRVPPPPPASPPRRSPRLQARACASQSSSCTMRSLPQLPFVPLHPPFPHRSLSAQLSSSLDKNFVFAQSPSPAPSHQSPVVFFQPQQFPSSQTSSSTSLRPIFVLAPAPSLQLPRASNPFPSFSPHLATSAGALLARASPSLLALSPNLGPLLSAAVRSAGALPVFVGATSRGAASAGAPPAYVRAPLPPAWPHPPIWFPPPPL